MLQNLSNLYSNFIQPQYVFLYSDIISQCCKIYLVWWRIGETYFQVKVGLFPVLFFVVPKLRSTSIKRFSLINNLSYKLCLLDLFHVKGHKPLAMNVSYLRTAKTRILRMATTRNGSEVFENSIVTLRRLFKISILNMLSLSLWLRKFLVTCSLT